MTSLMEATLKATLLAHTPHIGNVDVLYNDIIRIINLFKTPTDCYGVNRNGKGKIV